MENLGFTKEGDRAGSRIIYHLKDGGLKITTHDPGKTAKADMLRNVFNALKNIKWFDNEDNFKKFPFDRWQFNPNSIERNTITQDIQQANELYKNAEVYRVFYNNNPLSILKTKQGYNLCRSNEDRRPLLDKWYDGFEQGNIPTLKLDDYEKLETKAYPIKQNGTLDFDNVIIENKINNNMKKKQLIRLTESDLHNIIKESVKKVLKETRLDYDEDNFSGKYTKFKDDGINPDDYLDDPYNKPCNFEDEDWIDNNKDMEKDYSWDLFNQKSVAPSVGGYYNVNKFGIQKDIDDAHAIRKNKKEWTKKELNNGDRMMSKWVKGERNLDDIDDAWDGIH